MVSFQDAINRGDFDLKSITSGILPTMNTTFIELQDLMLQMQDSLKVLQHSPSDLLFKREEIKKAPGEE